jgi:hypothetical protein
MLLGWVDDDSATMLMLIQRHLAHRMTRDRTYVWEGEERRLSLSTLQAT